MPIVEAIAHLMDSEALSDVTFIVGQSPNQKTFNCHKLIFAARSDVFLAMFYGALRESDAVVIIDMEPDTFDAMRRYIYTDKLKPKDVDEAVKVYFAANKYNLVELMNVCYEYIEKNLNCDNVCQVHELAFYMEKQELKAACDKIIKNNPTEVLSSKGFTRATAEFVKKMLKGEGYSTRNELFFFQSVVKWAEKECERQKLKVTPVHMRQVLRPILPYIRFLDMKHEEFVKGPASSKILEPEEILAISMNIGLSGCMDLPAWLNSKPKNSRPTAVLKLKRQL